jgi:hypothetical protein
MQPLCLSNKWDCSSIMDLMEIMCEVVNRIKPAVCYVHLWCFGVCGVQTYSSPVTTTNSHEL